MQLQGLSLLGIAGEAGEAPGACFHGFDPRDGSPLSPTYTSATRADVERAAALARAAFAPYQATSGRARAQFLRCIASKLEGAKGLIVERAALETALPPARVTGELGRTCFQLRMFAALIEEGSWVEARLDSGDAAREPLPKPDLRSMLRAIGPVAVFGASNFPLAYSVAGGDTASALAAGCPVVVKAHPAHPATSEIVGRLLCQAARECQMPEGTFSLLFDPNIEIGVALVEHPAMAAVGFTGSRRGGVALMKVAAARPVPIPVFAEMSSINPVVITPAALHARGAAIAEDLSAAITLGVGQFCTNPGLVLLPQGAPGDAFIEKLRVRLSQSAPATMLTAGIGEAYRQGLAGRSHVADVVAHLLPTASPEGASAALLEVAARTFRETPALMEEIFGPATLVVRYTDEPQLLDLIAHLEGQLTATLHAQDDEIGAQSELVGALTQRVGRLIWNGFPTGVEVGDAIVHGGPFPATSDGQSTAVGTRAIVRWVRPVCFQNFPDEALPAELQNNNPLQIRRLVNGKLTLASADAATASDG